MNKEKSFLVANTKFTAVRKVTPIPHWLVRIDETGEVLQSGTAGISNESLPKMIESMEYLFSRIGKGNVNTFRKGWGLPAIQAD